MEETEQIHIDFEPKSNVYSLTILDNLKGMSGKVRVLAVNKEGEATAEATLKVTGRAAKFLEKPHKCTVVCGEKAFFSCKVDGDPKPKITWLKGKDIELNNLENHRTYVDELTNEHVLEIDKIEEKHAGIYTINIENEFGHEKTSAILAITANPDENNERIGTVRKLKNTIETKPKAITDNNNNNNNHNHNHNHNSNNRVRLKNSLIENEKVEDDRKKWDVNVPQRRRRRKAKSEHDHNTLTTTNAIILGNNNNNTNSSINSENNNSISKTDKEGKPVEMGNEQGILTQRRRPRNMIDINKIDENITKLSENSENIANNCEFIRKLSDLRVKEAENADFECEINQLNINVTWFTDDIQVVPSQKYQFYSDGYIHRLRINNLKLDDEGEVKCRINNMLTTAHLSVTTMKPYFIAKFFNKKVLEHADAYFICKLNEDLTVSWYHKGRIVPDNDKKYKILNEGLKKTLVIQDCNIEDSGLVKVFCRNVNCEANLRVEAFTSEFSKPLTNLTVRENSMAEFVCYTHHYQLRSSISWYIGSTKVVESPKYLLMSDGWKHTLRLCKVSKSEEGKITVRCKGDECIADLVVDGQFFSSERICKSVTHSPVEVIHDRSKCRLSSPVSPWKHGFECFIVQNDQNEIHCSRCEDSKKLLARMCECPREVDYEKENDHKNSSIGRRINRKLRYLSCPEELSSSPRIKETEPVNSSPKSDKIETSTRSIFSSPESAEKSCSSRSSIYRSTSGLSLGGDDVIKTLKDFSSMKVKNTNDSSLSGGCGVGLNIFDSKFLLHLDDASETETTMSSKSSLQYLSDVGKPKSRIRKKPNDSPPWKMRERLSLPIQPIYPIKQQESVTTVKDRVKYFEHCDGEKPTTTEDFPLFERESVKQIVEKFEKLSIEGKLMLIGRQENPDMNFDNDSSDNSHNSNIIHNDNKHRLGYRRKFNSLLYEILKELDDLSKKKNLNIDFNNVLSDSSCLFPKVYQLSKEELRTSIKDKINEVEKAIVEFLRALSLKCSKENNKFREGIVIYETIANYKKFKTNKYQSLDRTTLKKESGYFESRLQINPVTVIIKDVTENKDKQQFNKCLNEILRFHK